MTVTREEFNKLSDKVDNLSAKSEALNEKMIRLEVGQENIPTLVIAKMSEMLYGNDNKVGLTAMQNKNNNKIFWSIICLILTILGTLITTIVT